MYNEIWKKSYHSICSLNFYNETGKRIGGGTGFKVGNFLITNNHVFHAGGASYVEITFVQEDGCTIAVKKKMDYSDFQKRIQIGMPEESWDFAILDFQDDDFKEIPGLKLSNRSSPIIGTEIAVIGFQFDQKNLSIKRGIISSIYTKNEVKYIQLDASVNRGNSGGPLIDIKRSEVTGIVTRKDTGLTKAFDDLSNGLDSNIKALSAAQQLGYVSLMGINPIQVFQMGQEQLKIATREIYRSANVGIGYAFELTEIRKFFNS